MAQGYMGGEQKKLLIETTDGWRVYGSCPGAIYGADRGDVVRFDAKLQRSDKDPMFGFFSRPTKPVLVSKAVQS